MVRYLLKSALFLLLAALPGATAEAYTTFQLGPVWVSLPNPGVYRPMGHPVYSHYSAYRNGTSPMTRNLVEYRQKATTPVHMTPAQYATYSAKPPPKRLC